MVNFSQKIWLTSRRELPKSPDFRSEGWALPLLLAVVLGGVCAFILSRPRRPGFGSIRADLLRERQDQRDPAEIAPGQQCSFEAIRKPLVFGIPHVGNPHRPKVGFGSLADIAGPSS